MRNILRLGSFLLLLGFSSHCAFGGNVSGVVSGIWAPPEDFYVVGEATVPAGQTLTLAPNVRVYFHPRATLSVFGTLVINGTSQDPIEISGLNGQSWSGISFVGSTTNNIVQYTTIRNAATPLSATSSSLSITNSTIYCSSRGLSAISSTVNCLNSSFIGMSLGSSSSNSITGIYAENSTVSLTADTISVTNTNSGTVYAIGISSVSNSNLQVTDSWITVNSNYISTAVSVSVQERAVLMHNLIRCSAVYQSFGCKFDRIGDQSRVLNNTIRFVQPTTLDVGVYTFTCQQAEFRNNLLWGGGCGVGMLGNSSDNLIDWDYGLFYGFSTNYSGVDVGSHDLYTNPMLNSAYLPQSGSPVIDMGDPRYTDPDGSRSDIGCYSPFVTGISEPARSLPQDFQIAAYPNPFNGGVRFSVATTGNVDWYVFDRLGRIVVSGSGVAQQGMFVANWQPSLDLAAGMYLVELHSKSGVARRPLCYVR